MGVIFSCLKKRTPYLMFPIEDNEFISSDDDDEDAKEIDLNLIKSFNKTTVP